MMRFIKIKRDTEEWITEDLLLSIVKEKLPKVDVEQFKKDLHSKDIKEKKYVKIQIVLKIKSSRCSFCICKRKSCKP